MDLNLGAPKPRNVETPSPLPRPLPRTNNNMKEINIDEETNSNNSNNGNDNKINILNKEIDQVTNVLNDNLRVSLSNIENTEILTENTRIKIIK